MKKFYSFLLMSCLSFTGFSQSTTFYYTGGGQTYIVPLGVTSVGIDAIGGTGGGPYMSFGEAGPVANGGRVQCNLAVTGGQTLYIYVGGQGGNYASGAAAGFNGGNNSGGIYCASGGGATDIRLTMGTISGTQVTPYSSSGTGYSNNRVVVAGGGGGGGDYNASGGLGGGLTGGTGGIWVYEAYYSYGGTQSGGGTTSTGFSAANGSIGVGGPAGLNSGGGGGGYYGGAGGYEFNGGGGGSSYTDPILGSAVTHTQGYSGATGNGQVVITVPCAPPAAIIGNQTVCVGSATTLSDPTPGGTWSPTSTCAAVNAATGVVTGISAPCTAVITYTIPGGCYTTATVTVNAPPAVIIGNLAVCVGSATTLSDPNPGGTWSPTSICAAVNPATGVVTGISGPCTTVITYTLPGGCYTTATVTVNALPPACTLTGGGSYCIGQPCFHVGLSCSYIGVNYQLYCNGVAVPGSVLAGTGSALDFGLQCAAGVYTIVGTNAVTGCTNTMTGSVVITTYPLPVKYNVTGGGSYCAGSPCPIVGLNGSTTGVNYQLMCGSDTIATVAGTGSVITFGPQCASCVYKVIATNAVTGCTDTMTDSVVVTANPSPAPIMGILTLCAGTTTILTDSTPGGMWSDTSTCAAVNSAGIVTGISAPCTAVITYTLPGGCYTTVMVTVNPLPPACNLAGGGSYCPGQPCPVISLSCSYIGVNYQLYCSGDTGSITIAGTGSPISFGPQCTSCIYTVIATDTATGCTSRMSGYDTVTEKTPCVITGDSVICAYAATTLNGCAGCTWSSSNTAVAVGGSCNVFTGLSAGIDTITNTSSSGCISTITITVNPAPGLIAGSQGVCLGSTSALSDPVAGGSWSTSSTCAAITSAGVISGSSAPCTAEIIYTLPDGCNISENISVDGCASPDTTFARDTTSCCVDSLIINTGYDPLTGSAIPPGANCTPAIGHQDPKWIITQTSFATNCGAGGAVVPVGGPADVIQSIWGTPPAGSNWVSGLNSNEEASSTNDSITLTRPFSMCTADSIKLNLCFEDDNYISSITIDSTPWPYTQSGCPICTSNFSSFNCIDKTVYLAAGPHTINVVLVNVSAAVSGGIYAGIDIYGSIASATGTGSLVNESRSATASTLPVTGTLTLCAGTTTILTDAISGGTWSTTSTCATVNAAGIVTGISSPCTAIITYTLPGGCYTTVTVTVSPVPLPITGTLTLCAGTTTILTDSIPGGTWSGISTCATVNSAGVVTGISAPCTAIITYTLPGGCYTTVTVTVSPAPLSITGILTLCAGTTTILTDSITGGTWITTSTCATVNPVTGVVTAGISAPCTAVITYTLPGGCYTTATVNVTSCSPIDSTTVARDTTSCCVDSLIINTGYDPVTGAAIPPGTDCSTPVTDSRWIVTQSNFTSGCGAGGGGILVSIGSRADVINTGSSYWITNPAGQPGGWISCLNASFESGGTGGRTYDTMTLTRPFNMCKADSIIFSFHFAADNAISSINIDGIATSIADATTIAVGNFENFTVKTYAAHLNAGSHNINVVVLNQPNSASGLDIYGTIKSAGDSGSLVNENRRTSCCCSCCKITGATQICVGATTALSGSAGCSWHSGNTSIATIDSCTGVVTGVSGGVDTITHVSSVGCISTIAVTVDALPTPCAITGGGAYCTGGTCPSCPHIGLGCSQAGVNYQLYCGSAAVPPLLAGTGSPLDFGQQCDTCHYSIKATNDVIGCASVMTGTVTATPLTACVITGPTTVCVGGTITLSGCSGCSWSSSSAAIAIVGSCTGRVTGISGGVVTITYTSASGCISTYTVTVTPSCPITGILTLCVGQTTALSTPCPGGTWTSSNTPVAPVAVTTGAVTGAGAGTAIITYTSASGCTSTVVVTVNAIPVVPLITGVTDICAGGSVPLTGTPSGGSWALIGTGTYGSLSCTTCDPATFTGTTTGVQEIQYIVFNSCGINFATTLVTVGVMPPITGQHTVCEGQTIRLCDVSGTWTCTPSSVATVTATGICTTVYGVSPGTATITLTTGSGCFTTYTVTVEPSPAISGPHKVCAGSNITLCDTGSGSGTWSSSPAGIVTITSLSVNCIKVDGNAAGTSTITYTNANGCFATWMVTVNPMPSVPSPRPICEGSSLSPICAATVPPGMSGTWTCAPASVATASTGANCATIYGVSPGTTTLTFTDTAGCSASSIVIVDSFPAITGSSSLCAGTTISESGTPAGGAWSVGPAAVAMVTPAGVVHGVTAGTATLLYTNGGCNVLKVITVSPCHGILRSSADADTGTTNGANTTLKVFPNPNQGTFTVILQSDKDEPADVKITNVVGETVKKFTTVTNQESEIRINNAPGIYLVLVTTANGSYAAKVVVE